jgi:hypothetical protein
VKFIVLCGVVLMALAVLIGLNLSSRKMRQQADVFVPVGPGEVAARTRFSPSPSRKPGEAPAPLPEPPAATLPDGAQRIGSRGVFQRAEYQKAFVAGGTPAVEGEVSDVFVKVGSTGQKLHLTPNQGREFPRVYVREGETVQVRVEFTQSEPGSAVSISPQDGGNLSGHPAKVSVLDSDRAIAFDYTASQNPGTHRVKLVTQSGDAHLLDFWAGPENPYRTSTAATR